MVRYQINPKVLIMKSDGVRRLPRQQNRSEMASEEWTLTTSRGCYGPEARWAAEELTIEQFDSLF